MALSRKQFEIACKTFIHKCDSGDDPLYTQKHPAGWTWKEHPTYPGLGYMARQITTTLRSQEDNTRDTTESDDSVQEVEDVAVDASRPSPLSELINAQLWVVYAVTFQVPAFYFSAHRSNGVPLTLTEITKLSMFRQGTLPAHTGSTFALSTPDPAFALLSQGDHPTLGTPCWYLHPCNTAEVVGEIMDAVDCREWGEAERLSRWLEAWFSVVGNIVDLPRGER